MQHFPSPFDGFRKLGRRGGGGPAAYLSHVLLRAGDGDWSAFGTTQGAPVITAEKAVFDGVDDALVADFTRDYSGCSIWMVAKVLSTDNAQDAAFNINPGTTASVGLAARTSGQFLNQMRLPAASGYGSTLVGSVDVQTAETNIVGTTTLIGIIVETDGSIYCVNVGSAGNFAAGKTTRPAAINMTKVQIGRSASGFFNNLEAYEFLVLDTTDVAVVESYLQDVKTRFSLTVPWITPLKRTTILVTGDSIGAGALASSNATKWSYITADNFITDLLSLAIADTQVSPLGLVGAAKIDGSFARVMTAGNLTGKSAAISFAGSNDWTGAAGIVPVGTYGSTDENTFYGALWDGFEDFLLNAPAGINLYLCTTVNNDTTTTNTLGHTILDYDAAIRNFVATKNHSRLHLIDTRLAGLVNPADFADGVHPNDTGYAKLAAYITAAIAARYGVNR